MFSILVISNSINNKLNILNNDVILFCGSNYMFPIAITSHV